MSHKRRHTGLWLRGTVWQLRIRVPADVRERIGRTHVNRSLRTSIYAEAVRKARTVAWEIEDRFCAARASVTNDLGTASEAMREGSGANRAVPSPSLVTVSTGPVANAANAIVIDLDALVDRIAERFSRAEPSPGVPDAAVRPAVDLPASPPLPSPPAKTIRTVYEAFMADPGVIRSSKTVLAYETVFNLLIEIIGADTPIAAVTREMCREVTDTLRRLPSNARKRFPKLTAREIAGRFTNDPKATFLSSTTVNGYIDKLPALMTWAVNEGYIDRNPAKGLGVVETKHKRDKRNPFAVGQLQKIFSAPLYMGCKDDGHGYAEPGPTRPRRCRFWIPLIGLFSGMRLNEICQLNTEDVRTVDGVECLIVTANTINGIADKRLKTGSSERVVPIHPQLIKLGFIDYVKEQRRRQSPKLFPDLAVACTGYYSDDFSKWFRRFLQKSGASTGQTCFHSFRHNFRDALREARVERELALALDGWSGDSSEMGAESAEFYGRGFRASTLRDAIARVQYAGLDLSHLDVVC